MKIWKSSGRELERLYFKRDLIDAGDTEHEKIKTGLMILGGGLQGVASMAMVSAFAYLRLHGIFDYVLGISSGAISAAYLLSSPGAPVRGVHAFLSDDAQKVITPHWRGLRGVKTDINLLRKILRNPEMGIDKRLINRSPSEFYVGVTAAESGRFSMLNAKLAKPNMEAALLASAALPGFVEPVEVNKRRWSDGFSHPLPIQEFVEDFGLTDVLILAPKDPLRFRRDPFVLRWKTRELPERFRRNLNLRRRRWERAMNYLERAGDLHCQIIWPRMECPRFPSAVQRELVAYRMLVATLIQLGADMDLVRKAQEEFQRVRPGAA